MKIRISLDILSPEYFASSLCDTYLDEVITGCAQELSLTSDIEESENLILTLEYLLVEHERRFGFAHYIDEELPALREHVNMLYDTLEAA